MICAFCPYIEKALRSLRSLWLIFFILFALVPPSSAYPQTLTELYVTESGVVLGAIFALDVRFPAHALVRGNGVLVWVNIEIPGAIVEVSLYGGVSLVERMPPGSVSYKDGRISQIGDLRLEYDSGKVRAIGDLLFDYYGWGLGQTGKINRIGNMPVVIEDGFLIGLGSIRLEYKNGLISKIDDLNFFYESGRIQQIGDVRFSHYFGFIFFCSFAPDVEVRHQPVHAFLQFHPLPFRLLQHLLVFHPGLLVHLSRLNF